MPASCINVSFISVKLCDPSLHYPLIKLYLGPSHCLHAVLFKYTRHPSILLMHFPFNTDYSTLHLMQAPALYSMQEQSAWRIVMAAMKNRERRCDRFSIFYLLSSGIFHIERPVSNKSPLYNKNITVMHQSSKGELII